MPPGELYQLAIVVTALFVAPFNALARVVVLAWIAGHVCFALGVPELTANIAGQACVLILGKRHLRDAASLHAWLLSAPLLAINLCWAVGVISPWVGWWTVLIVATVQLVTLSLAVDSRIVHEVMSTWRENGGRGMFRVSTRR